MNATRDLIEETLRAHGVAADVELLDELESVVRGGQEWWNSEEIAQFLGVKPVSVKTWCARRGIRRQWMAPAEVVRYWKDRMPGRGVGGGRRKKAA